MAPAPKKKRSKAQQAASRKWAAAGRAKQASAQAAYKKAHGGKAPPRTKAETAASQRWAAAGRAAQAARRAGKTPVSSKKAAAALPAPAASLLTDYGSIHELPVCASIALAAHLDLMTGAEAATEDILGLWLATPSCTLEEVLEAARDLGFAGHKLISFRPVDPQVIVPGCVCGLRSRYGYHAVLAHPAGLVSWGLIIPWGRLAAFGTPEEAWALEWETA